MCALGVKKKKAATEDLHSSALGCGGVAMGWMSAVGGVGCVDSDFVLLF